ncbi:hypothetical protein GCM10022277_24070 [Litoribacillus peritrichatus]|uniref:Uncharacterized protein n=1 Tax=Litoribacillus peritrichatus TaxID=718191 RepID=A0ABP7MRD3_9GAMM
MSSMPYKNSAIPPKRLINIPNQLAEPFNEEGSEGNEGAATTIKGRQTKAKTKTGSN